jgi:C4-dicarboxylate-specific signal transduction histidine kinase
VLNLNEMLTQSDAMLRSLLGEDVDIQMSLSRHLGLLSANRQELLQLISNLMTSARETLPLGGSVHIETSNIEIEPPSHGDAPDIQPGTYVLITLSADGCSIQPERRTGSIQSIVDRMGGWLKTANNTHSGNVYKIYLPRVETFVGENNPSS